MLTTEPSWIESQSYQMTVLMASLPYQFLSHIDSATLLGVQGGHYFGPNVKHSSYTFAGTTSMLSTNSSKGLKVSVPHCLPASEVAGVTLPKVKKGSSLTFGHQLNTSYTNSNSDRCSASIRQGKLGSLQNIRGPPIPFEVLGDNLDLLKTPSDMTMVRQRESWNWFLLLAAQKRILGPHPPNDRPKANICQLSISEWLPTIDELDNYQSNIHHHISATLVKYLPALSFLSDSLPEYIDHPYQKQRKSQR